MEQYQQGATSGMFDPEFHLTPPRTPREHLVGQSSAMFNLTGDGKINFFPLTAQQTKNRLHTSIREDGWSLLLRQSTTKLKTPIEDYIYSDPTSPWSRIPTDVNIMCRLLAAMTGEVGGVLHMVLSSTTHRYRGDKSVKIPTPRRQRIPSRRLHPDCMVYAALNYIELC
ncbi:unnamed protein product [Boreogadus saida]